MDRRRRLQVAARLGYVLLTVALVVFWGIPTKHDLLFLWLGLGMAAFSFEASRIVRDWLPLVGIILTYDVLRGIADGLVFHAREVPQIKVEAALFGKPVPTVWLQEHFWHGPNDLHWWDYAAWFLHLTHFFATFIALAVIWVVRREAFARYSAMVCVLSMTAFVTYVLYPAVPPWMAAQQGQLGESNRIVDIVWHHIPVANGGAVFEHGKGYANNVAAMPSLHSGFSLLLTLYLWRLVPRYWRPLLALYPLAMALALVYTGEHYVVDCFAGWIYAAGSYAGVNAYCAWRESRVPALAHTLAD